jgi:2-amino-4-hydroxy-6-hydroxymethyldihydropteridine diphosphokinase
MTATVYVGLGSNVDREKNILGGIREIRRVFGGLELSPVYESEAVGFDGGDFLNLVVGFKTVKPVRDVVLALRVIEDRLGRDRSLPRFSHRSIDLDILSYDDLQIDETGLQIPRKEILENSFVLRPLQDIAAGTLHPVLKQSYAELWAEMKPGAIATRVFKLALE